MFPIETNYAKIIRMMIENGAQVNAGNKTGNTALHQAAAAGNDEAIKLLLKYGADIYIKNKYVFFVRKFKKKLRNKLVNNSNNNK